MAKVFLDAGAHDGCSARHFRKEYDKESEYFIYSFEADPYFSKYFGDLDKQVFINCAVWVEDGELSFYKSSAALRDGGTLVKSKRTGMLDKDHPAKVTAIDFSKWVKDNLSKDDYIILKMDIEGAEYSVLPKMFTDGSFAYVDELWIEWHYKKINLPKSEHDVVASQIKIPTKPWCALKWCVLRGDKNAK